MCWKIRENKGSRFLVRYTGYVIPCGQQATVFKRIILFSSIMFFCLFIGHATANVTGTAFRDYNANGIQDALEPGAGGIDVKAYNASGDVVASDTTTDEAPGIPNFQLNFPGGTLVRIEFNPLSGFLFAGPHGADSGTTVIFPNRGAKIVNVAVGNPGQYCQDEDEVFLATACYVNGDPLLGGTASTADVFVSFPYTATGGSLGGSGTPTPTKLAKGEEVGAVWGLAYQRSTSTLFAGAFMRRHVGFGPGGTGAIYQISPSGAFTPSLFVDLISLGIDAGLDAHAGLPQNTNEQSADGDAFDAVGKVSLGDVEISEDDKTLWVVNLNDANIDGSGLYEIFINSPPVVPTAAEITAHDIIGFFNDNYTCTMGVFRPWALKVSDGLVYVGGVCTAENAGVAADLHAYIFAHDTNGPPGNFTLVLDFPLDFPRGQAVGGVPMAPWQPWTSTYMNLNTSSSTTNVVFPQPALADIELDIDGSLILGFIDRFGAQMGAFQLLPEPLPDGTNPTIQVSVSTGDILRACKVDGGFVLEGQEGCDQNFPTDPPTTADFHLGPLPGGGEFYGEEHLLNPNPFPNRPEHEETSLGALAHLFGSGEVVNTVMAAVRIVSNGVRTFDNQTGEQNNAYQVFQTIGGGGTGTQSKALGLGDLELLCEPAPLEIGNFVWTDLDGDGTQDPGEPGLAGVDVQLFSSDADLIGETVTDTNGEYYFGGLENLNLGAGNTLEPNTSYVVVIDRDDVAPGLTLSPAFADEVWRDSNGVDIGGDWSATVTTGPSGANDHTIDFGIRGQDGTDFGVGTPGYWKNHPEAWPVDEITIGGNIYTKDGAIALMLDNESSDVTYILFRALVAAKLNALVEGNDSTCVDETIVEADAWMAAYPVGSGVKARGQNSHWREGEPLYLELDEYNNGELCEAPRI